jgi:hypothetical protein
MLDNIFNKLVQESARGAQKPSGLRPGDSLSRCLLNFDFRNTIPHFSLLPLAVVRYLNPGSHDPVLIFFKSERKKIERECSIAYNKGKLF